MIRRLNFIDISGGFIPAVLVFLLAVTALAQELPNKIRGYKVHQDKISVNSNQNGDDAAVRIENPTLIDISLAGVTFELHAELTTAKQSGRVEMITFHDLRVNGVLVDPEEYTHRFEFRKGENVVLPKPVRVFVPASGMFRAASQEITESKAEWTVTGRVFVFGKFRKFGIYHKRVIPIDLTFSIPNPTR